MTAGMEELTVKEDELDRRIIEPADFVADTAAFIDVRLPGSTGKASYSFIGPGVSQNADQVVNVTEPHGFNIGAASMPAGAVNNQHMHYTAEVFICTRGQWEMCLGQNGEQTVDIGPDTVFSVPTWVFRGFRNTGDDDGWLFTVLGGDDTGGILWAPQILEAAAATGLHLSEDYEVVDAPPDQPPAGGIAPIGQDRLAHLDRYSAEEIRQRIVEPGQLQWSESALLSSVVPGHETAMAPVIGFGLTEDRQQRPPIWNPHGFTLEWLRVEPGASTGLHRIAEHQALFLVSGDWQIRCNHPDERVERTAETGAVISVPASAWRDLANVGDTPATCLVVCAGDQRSVIDWDADVLAEATKAGIGRDASGYLAPLDLLGRRTS